MANGQLTTVVKHIRGMVEPPATDAQALERFIIQRDEQAFAALLRRHGSMVLSVSRGVLGNTQDAEDVFQATFLLLARKAGSIRKRESVGSWLHGVAHRLAQKEKAKRTLRSYYEKLGGSMHADRSGLDTTWRELQAVLHEELGRLPEKYRTVFILCAVEEKTHEQAAQQLGCPLGTVRSRIGRARKLLQGRLTRRGLGFSAQSLATVLAVNVASAAISPALQRCTLKAALQFAAGQGAKSIVPATVATLVEGGLRAMHGAKLMTLTVLLLVASVMSGGVCLLAHGALVTTQAKTEEAQVPPLSGEDKGRESASEPTRADLSGDPLPDGSLLRVGTVRYRAGGAIDGAALSPDGKRLAAVSESGISLFDLATGKRQHVSQAGVPHGFGYSILAFSPSGNELIGITKGANLRFWDVPGGKLLRQLGNRPEPMPELNGVPPPLAPVPNDPRWSQVWFPPGGKNLVVATDNHTMLVLDPLSGKVRQQFRIAGELAAIASDGKGVASIDTTRSEVVLYDEKGAESQRFRHPGVYLAALCSRQSALVTANDEAEIRVWKPIPRQEPLVIKCPVPERYQIEKRLLTVLTTSPDGKTLFAGTKNGDILRWDLDNGKEQSTLRGHRHWITGLFLQPDGRTLVSVGWDNAIQRWDIVKGEPIASGQGYVGQIQIARSPDDRTIIVGDSSGRIEWWDVASGKPIRSLAASGPYPSKLRYSPDGKWLAIAQSDFSVRLCDADGGREVRKLQLPVKGPSIGAWFEELEFSPDSRFLFSSESVDGPRMWEVATGRELWHEGGGGKAAFSPDGQTFVTGKGNDPLSFRDSATGKIRFSLKEETSGTPSLWIYGMAFSPDGSVLATCQGPQIYLRDPVTGKRRKTLQGQAWLISFSADSKWLASSGDQSVRIWEVATGVEVLRLIGHVGRTLHAQFGRDSRTLLSSSLDSTALLWSTRPTRRSGQDTTLEALWKDLAGDPAKAYRAIWALVEDPKASDFLARKILPVRAKPDHNRVRRLLAELDSENSRVRDAASGTLAEMGATIQVELRLALRDTKSAEVETRVKKLLAALVREPTPEELRRARAVQVLELSASPASEHVLSQWARGTANAPLTEQARAALARLRKHR